MVVTFTRKDMNSHEHATWVVVTFDDIGYRGTSKDCKLPSFIYSLSMKTLSSIVDDIIYKYTSGDCKLPSFIYSQYLTHSHSDIAQIHTLQVTHSYIRLKYNNNNCLIIHDSGTETFPSDCKTFCSSNKHFFCKQNAYIIAHNPYTLLY